MVGDRSHRAVAGWQRLEQGRSDALGRAGARLQIGEAPAELGREEPPHRFVFGEERTGGVFGSEADGLGGPIAQGYTEVLRDGVWIGWQLARGDLHWPHVLPRGDA